MAARRLISSGSPFEAAFGYSRAVLDGDDVFVSGTTGYDYVTMTMPDDVADQARNIARTFAAVLAEAGASLANIRAGDPSSPAPIIASRCCGAAPDSGWLRDTDVDVVYV